MAGVELTDRLCVAQRQLGKFWIGADVLEDLPRAGAFPALGPGKHHGDARHLLQAKGGFGAGTAHKFGTAGDGNLGEIDPGKRFAQVGVGDMDFGRCFEA